MSREGCVCCPYPLLTIPGLLSFIALVFVWVAAINCNFFEITYWIVTEQGDAGRLGVLSVGLWTVQSYFIAASGDYSWGSFCVGWNSRNLISDLELDAPLRAARAFSMISATLGTVAFCLLLVPICVSFGEQSQYLLVLCTISVFVGFATLLDLVALSSNLCKSASSCTLQGAGILAIVGGLLWLVIAGLLYWALKNPRSFRGDDDTYVVATAAHATVIQEPPPEQKEISTIQNADGSVTKTTTVTVTNGDGSKTVTQTTEIIPASSFP